MLNLNHIKGENIMDERKKNQRLAMKKYAKLAELRKKQALYGVRTNVDYLAKIYDLQKQIAKVVEPDFTDGLVDIRMFAGPQLPSKTQKFNMNVFLHGETEKIGDILVEVDNATKNVSITSSFSAGIKPIYQIHALNLIRNGIETNRNALTLTMLNEEKEQINAMRALGAKRDFTKVTPYAEFKLNVKRK